MAVGLLVGCATTTTTLPRPPREPHLTAEGDLTQPYREALRATFPEVRSLDGKHGCWPHPDRPEELQRCYVYERLNALEGYVYSIGPLWKGD